MTRDLTERKEAELARERFIANAAHELRTPLSVIIGVATHLKNPAAVEDPEFPELVEALTRQSTRMRNLVNNLLDMTQIGQGRLRVTLEEVRLDTTVGRVMQILSPPGRKTVDTRIPALTVRADPLRLEQVVTNLVSNAYRYGGDRIEMSARAAGTNRVILDVIDNGPGVPVELATTLFEPFKRGPAHQRIEGSGLGLAITRGMIEAMGGTIDLMPNDPGAHFRIVLQRGGEA